MQKTPFVKPIVIVMLLILGNISIAHAFLIDLNLFSANPDSALSISADGTSALFTEKPGLLHVELSNTNLLLPENALELSFDYELDVPALNKDFFNIFIDDLSTPYGSVGGNFGNYSGHMKFNLSQYTGISIGMIFDFTSSFFDSGLESTLSITNLDITSSPTPVPLPGPLLMLSSGLFGLLFTRRKKIKTENSSYRAESTISYVKAGECNL